MIEIKMTINGRPLTECSFESEMERAAIASIKAKVQEKLQSVPSELDGEKLIVKVVGTSLNDLSVDLHGPVELVEKAKRALGAS